MATRITPKQAMVSAAVLTAIVLLAPMSWRGRLLLFVSGAAVIAVRLRLQP